MSDDPKESERREVSGQNPSPTSRGVRLTLGLESYRGLGGRDQWTGKREGSATERAESSVDGDRGKVRGPETDPGPVSDTGGGPWKTGLQESRVGTKEL